MLSVDEKEDLQNVVDSDAYKVLLKLLDACAQKSEAAVLKFDLSQGDRPLVIAKARSEGARALISDFHRLVETTLKARQKG